VRERAILHVDMDAFFASVEQLDDPSLRGKPVLVGGPSKRGVVLAASYEARPSGARSAMPMAQALRRCPNALVVPPRHERYAEVSASVFAIFARYTPLVEGLSVDEAFLDVTASQSLFGDGEAIAHAIKRDVCEEIGITASAGVAPSKFVAKIASDLEKPDGLVVVRAADVVSFLAPLPIERMWGVGPKTAPRLRALGMSTLGDLARTDVATLERLLGVWGPEASRLARGEDARDVDPDRAAKSVGAEETFEEDIADAPAIARTLLAHASRVAQRLYEARLAGRVVVVKLKTTDFVVHTRRAKLPEPVADTEAIYDAARTLLGRFDPSLGPVRLTGVSVSELVDVNAPASLFVDDRRERQKKLEGVTRDIAERYGKGHLMRAALLDKFGPGK